MQRRWVGLVAVLAAASVGSPAVADEIPVAVYVEGRAAELVRRQVLQALPEDVSPQPGRPIRQGLGKIGLGKNPARAMQVKASRIRLLKRIRVGLAKSGADAALVVHSKAVRNEIEVWMMLVAPSGRPGIRESVSIMGPGDPTQDIAAMRRAMAPAFDALRAPPPPEPEPPPPPPPPPPDPTPDTTPDTTPDPEPVVEKRVEEPKRRDRSEPAAAPGDAGSHRLPRYHLEAAFELAGRNFVYVDRQTANLRTHLLGGIPLVVGSAGIYPFGDLGVEVVDQLGVRGHFAWAPSVYSQTPDGTRVDNIWSHFDVGVHYRWPFAGEAGPVLGGALSFAGERFNFLGAGGLADQLPDVSYKALRAGADIAATRGRFTLNVDLGWKLLLARGLLSDRFPNARTRALDLTVGLTAELLWGLEVRLALRYARYGHRLNTEPGDTYVALRAVDEHSGLLVGVGWGL